MISKWLKILIGTTALIFIAGCNAGDNQTNIEIFQGMFDQISNKAQDFDEIRQVPSNLVPPENTVPRGFKPYKYKQEPYKAEKNLKNPLKGKLSEKDLAVAKKKYDVYCGVCHGDTGAGDGRVAGVMTLKPPSLLTSKVKNFNDGRIFHIITDGQGVMGSYSRQLVNVKNRWKVVNYVRLLQKNNK